MTPPTIVTTAPHVQSAMKAGPNRDREGRDGRAEVSPEEESLMERS